MRAVGLAGGGSRRGTFGHGIDLNERSRYSMRKCSQITRARKLTLDAGKERVPSILVTQPGARRTKNLFAGGGGETETKKNLNRLKR